MKKNSKLFPFSRFFLSKAFTLTEVLITSAILVISASLVLHSIRPGETLKRGRDTQRISNVKNFEKLMQLISISDSSFNPLNYLQPKTVYLSLPDNSTSCASYQNELPPLPSGWSYRCSPNPQNIDGTGWIPIPFNTNPSVKISKLPLDPINKPPYYYSFIVDDGYKFASNLESTSYKGPGKLSSKDGGIRDDIYEVGSQLTLLVPYSREQETFISFVKAIGGVNDDSASFIQQTSDGGYIVSGLTSSFGAGSDDGMIIKLDSLGNVEWAKAIGGSGADHAYFIRQTSDGGYIIQGITNSFGAGGYDYLVIKLNSSGDIQWSKTIGGGSADYGNAIFQTSDGGYIAVGRTTSFGAGSADALIVKLNSSGDINWAKTIGGASAEYAYFIQQTADGKYVVGGHTASFGSGNYDIFVIKLDSSGNIDWVKAIGGSGNEYANSIYPTSDGGYIVGGYTYSFGAGSRDAFIIKLNSSSDLQWAKTIGGLNDDPAFSIQQTSDGGYIIGGRTTTFGAGGSDFLIAKLDPSGNCSNCSWIQSISPSISSGSINSILVNPTIISPSISFSTPSLNIISITPQISTICEGE